MSDLHLFDGFGIELEYMLVDQETLDVSPCADAILATLNDGQLSTDFEDGPITWSNELVLHVLELKTTQPAQRLGRVVTQFEAAISKLRPNLQSLGKHLLPTAMHPWMNPAIETRIWPHEYHEIYQTYDRIFNCRAHGWANVQSVHLNLPFCGDEEFARLHAAIRLVLPLLPALSASSPIVEGKRTGRLDNRLHYYAHHCDVIPSMIGNVIPEPVYDQASYQRVIFDPINHAVAPHDPEHVMNHEFLNARGAIGRFDRGSIEVRVMDVQEYPLADIAICGAVIAVVKMLVEESWGSLDDQKAMPTENLRAILDSIVVEGERTMIEDGALLKQFGINKSKVRAATLWRTLIERAAAVDASVSSIAAPLEVILQNGTLSTRILNSLGDSFGHDDLRDVYSEIADCLYRWEAYYPS